MTLERDETESMSRRDPALTLQGCRRILVLGRTGSGKTTLARELAAAVGVPHVELDALYFGPQFSTVPLPLLRERTSAAIAGDRWVTDGNKSAVRDLVWPRADTVIWLDYPLAVSLWRLGKRALWRTSVLKAEAAAGTGGKASLPRQLLSAAKGRAHGAPVARGPASRVSPDVRRAEEPAPGGGAPPVAACHPPLAGTRHRGVAVPSPTGRTGVPESGRVLSGFGRHRPARPPRRSAGRRSTMVRPRTSISPRAANPDRIWFTL